MQLALGLIETKGLVGAIEAADAMLKAANVKLIKKEKITAALITIEIEGEVAAVKSAVDAGAAAAQRVGQLISTHIIPRPDSQIDKIIKFSNKSGGHSEIRPEKVAKPEISVERKENIEEIHEAQEKTEQIEEDINIVESEMDSQEEVEQSEADNSESESNLEIENIDEASDPDSIVEEVETEIDIKEESNSKDQNIDVISDSNNNLEQKQPANEPESSASEIKKKNKLKKSEDKNFSFDFEDDDKEDESLSKHSIEELRKQAILELETEDNEEPETDEVSIEIPAKDVLETMNVHQLRHLARSIENFPIKGREISKANRKVLIDYFLELK